MPDALCLNKQYSTTRLLTQEIPEISNNPKDKFETLLFLPEGENRKGEGGLRAKGYFKKSYEDKPLISIITVVYNGEKYLEETIQSVLNQTYDNVEYIIIDGGSSDGTVNIIKKYEDQIDYWVSEADRGISDAFNKGKKTCQGKYHIFINSDDTFEDHTVLSSLVKYFLEDYDLICGGCILDYSSAIKKIYANSYGYKMPTAHQSMFFNTAKLDLYEYDIQNKLTMDYDFYLKYLKNEKNVYSEIIISRMKMVGVSQQNICKTAFSYISLNYLYNSKKFLFMSILSMLKGCTNTFLAKILK